MDKDSSKPKDQQPGIVESAQNWAQSTKEAVVNTFSKYMYMQT